MFNMKKEQLLEKIFLITLVLAFFMLVLVNIVWGEHWINSDMSAELMFSDLLREQGKWIATSDWYYSTEFRVLYTQLVMVPLLYIFEDWTTVRILTNICFYIGMLATYLYLCKQLGIAKRYVYATALGLMIPISEAVMTHVQMGNTYMSHIILVFLGYALFLQLVKANMGIYRKITLWAIFLALSFVLGISGVRYLLDLYVPIMITSLMMFMRSSGVQTARSTCNRLAISNCLRQPVVRYFVVGLLGSIVAAMGYVFNAITLSHIYTFQTYSSTDFIQIQGGVLLERIQNAIGALLQLFGYITNKSFISLHGLVTMIAFVILVMLAYVWNKTKGYCVDQTEDAFTVYFVAVSCCLHVFVFVFTTSTMVDRYFIPVFIFMLPVIACYMQKEKLVLDKYVVAVLLLGCLGLMGLKTVYSFASNDKNEDRYDVVDFLEGAGYSFGYASYWNANITTELSDGNIEVANLWSIDSLGDFKWSSSKKVYEEKSGEIFLLVSKDEIGAIEKHGIDQTQPLIYANDSYRVYSFEQQDDFLTYRIEEQGRVD